MSPRLTRYRLTVRCSMSSVIFREALLVRGGQSVSMLPQWMCSMGSCIVKFSTISLSRNKNVVSYLLCAQHLSYLISLKLTILPFWPSNYQTCNANAIWESECPPNAHSIYQHLHQGKTSAGVGLLPVDFFWDFAVELKRFSRSESVRTKLREHWHCLRILPLSYQYIAVTVDVIAVLCMWL